MWPHCVSFPQAHREAVPSVSQVEACVNTHTWGWACIRHVSYMASVLWVPLSSATEAATSSVQALIAFLSTCPIQDSPCVLLLSDSMVWAVPGACSRILQKHPGSMGKLIPVEPPLTSGVSSLLKVLFPGQKKKKKIPLALQDWALGACSHGQFQTEHIFELAFSPSLLLPEDTPVNKLVPGRIYNDAQSPPNQSKSGRILTDLGDWLILPLFCSLQLLLSLA